MMSLKKHGREAGKTLDVAPTIAIIGCGAITESFHLPALARHPSVRRNLILVDRNLKRARDLAARHEVGASCCNYQDIVKTIDGAVIAVPHQLHYGISLECLKNGVHVLCEKPLAESLGQANEIIAAADENGVRVCVNNNRRLFPSLRKVHQLVTSGEIGSIRNMEIYHGEKFDWPTATAAYFGKHSSGKGVLLDTGAHILDLVCWWFGEKPQLMSYADDSFGGAEGVARLSFQYGTCSGEVHLSWLSKLKNLYRVHGECATIEVGIYDWRSVTVVRRNGKRTTIHSDSEIRDFADVANMVLDNFVDVIRHGNDPLVSARDVAGSIELIDECYARRSRFHMPWHDTFVGINHEF